MHFSRKFPANFFFKNANFVPISVKHNANLVAFLVKRSAISNVLSMVLDELTTRLIDSHTYFEVTKGPDSAMAGFVASHLTWAPFSDWSGTRLSSAVA